MTPKTGGMMLKIQLCIINCDIVISKTDIVNYSNLTVFFFIAFFIK